MELKITAQHRQQYERDGYAIVRGGFTADECDRFVAYMLDLLYAHALRPLFARGG